MGSTGGEGRKSGTRSGSELLKKESAKEINWTFVFFLSALHLPALYGLLLIITRQYLYSTLFYALLLHALCAMGVTVGAHRLWTHRAFKAKAPLKLLLIILHTMTAQNTLWLWVAMHRVHHKYSDTDKDPHNARRGFWFSHVGWALTFDFQEFYQNLKVIDMTDIDADPFVMWQKRCYHGKAILFAYVLPALVPWLFWGESWEAAFFIPSALRIVLTVHSTFAVNSFAHLYGNKPYDRNIMPVENRWVSHWTLGEGWHNFHHAFPWDYRASELGMGGFNPSTTFIDLFARIGWAYDLKTASPNIVQSRAKRSGDGTVHMAASKFREIDSHILRDPDPRAKMKMLNRNYYDCI